MPITGDRYGFTESNVNKEPAEHGVYALYDKNEIIYIGRASGDGVTIRSRLKSHYRGDEGLCTVCATGYRREVTSRPIDREAELLDVYEEIHSAFPRCNDRRA